MSLSLFVAALATAVAAPTVQSSTDTSSRPGLPGFEGLPVVVLPTNPETPDGYVVNGTTAAPDVWPDAASVAGSCTGTLIHPRFVVTADHCVGGIPWVAVGFVDYEEFRGDELPREQMDVVDVKQEHRVSGSYDIALLELERPITAVTPRIIAQDCAVEEWLDAGGRVAVVGWGATNYNGRGFTTTLQEGFTEVQTPDCNDEYVESSGYEVYTGCDERIAPGGEIGAGGNDVDACFGDSGGPLYLETPSGWYLIGVTSRSYLGVPSSEPCRYGGIYVRPDSVLSWMEEVIGEPLPRPACSIPPTAEAERLALRAGQTRTVTLTVDDPDGEAWSVSVDTPPEHGEVEIDGTTVRYTADKDYLGEDPFTLRVEDDGSPDWPDNPPGSVVITAQVDVFEGKPDPDLKPYVKACGCQTSGPIGGVTAFGLLALLGLRRRRVA